MSRPDALAIAAVLRDIATALRIKGESKFRVRAYEQGAQAFEAFTGDLDRWITEGRLVEIPGIGEKLAALITEIWSTGTTSLLTTVTEGLPPGALQLARGPKLSLRALKTLSDANIRTVDALYEAAKGGGLRTLRGFSEKTEARIRSEIDKQNDTTGSLRLHEALAIAAELAKFMRGEDAQSKIAIDVVGDARRGLEVVDHVSLLATADAPPDAIARFRRYPRFLATEANETWILGRLPAGVRVTLHAALPSSRGAALQRLTGSPRHNADFDRAAEKVSMVVDESGLFSVASGSRVFVPVDSEEVLYARVGLQYVAPEVRDGEGEIERAARHALPRLVALEDIRGMVHCHTNYSDGRHSIEEMARAAEDLGMNYITITDHSPTAHYAHGVEIDRLHKQWDEIARVQERVAIRILRGTESDILKDGALDYPDSILEQLDVVVASVHNRYRLNEREMTARIVRAMRHPLFKIWGHALGRILLHRPAIACNLDAILDAAAESNAAIEINGDPFRLDMAPDLSKRARAHGLRFVVSVDAHSIRNFANLELGLTMARRTGLEPRDVLNTLDVDSFVDAVRPAR